MELKLIIDSIYNWIEFNFIHLAVSFIVIFIYFLVDRFTTPKLEEGIEVGKFRPSAAENAVFIARLITGVVGFLILIFVWGIEFTSILVFAGTTLTLLGVALFAQWSILSNITSYFILLLHPSFKRGSFVRIIDADNYVEGYISEVTLFNTKLITENRESIVYPNNLLLTRPAQINPRDRKNAIGKITESQ